MIFTTLYSVNTNDFTCTHSRSLTHSHTYESEKTNWQESNVVHFAISFCVTLHPETVANSNLFAFSHLYSYSYSYYVCRILVTLTTCVWMVVWACLFVHNASLTPTHIVSLTHTLSLPFFPMKNNDTATNNNDHKIDLQMLKCCLCVTILIIFYRWF